MHRILSILFSFVLMNGNAQLPTDIKFTNYTRTSGLPEENINNILQDSRGFLWLGTREGLIRFDGLNFLTWYANPSDSSMFSNNNIVLIAEYKPGMLLFQSGNSLWQINIFNHRLSQVKRLEEKSVTIRPVRMPNGYWCMANTDSIFILDADLRILKSRPVHTFFSRGQLINFFPLHHPYTLVHAMGLNRFYLMNYLDGRLTALQFENSGLDSRYPYFTPSAWDSTNKRLYLSAYFNGNFYCDLSLPDKTNYNPVPIPALPDGTLRKIILLPDGRVMMGCDNGLYLTDFRKTLFFNSYTKTDKPLLSNTVLDICQAADGTYWLATTKGLSRFSLDNGPVHYWQTELNLPETVLKAILKPGDGHVYFLSEEKSLMRIQEQTAAVQQLGKEIRYGWSAALSDKNIIATGGGRKLLEYNTRTGRATYPVFLEPFYTENTDLVTLAFRSKNGDMWYSFNGNGGIIRNPAGTGNYIRYSSSLSPPSFSHRYVHAAAEDSQGNIWWGNNKTQMLLKWDAGKQQFLEFPVGELVSRPLIKAGINNLFVDADDNLWIALDGTALLKYNIATKKGSYYDINNGLPANSVNSICADARNRLWFGTRKGLCCYLPEKDKVLTFTRSDGLPEDDFEGTGILYDKTENKLYAGARTSIAFFNPDSLLANVMSARPVVFIDEMRVNGKLLYFENEKKILLAPKENNIEFRFASPDYNRNNQLIFQYRLKGASGEWTDLDDKRNLTFNNLQHGQYNLSIRCKYRGTGEWAETSFPFSFTIKTPWQQTGWFRLLIAFSVAGFAWAMVRIYYRRKLEKQKSEAEKIQAVEKERTRIATDMHDDFGASLSRIKFISEKVQLTEKENEGLKKSLAKISEYSDEMAEKMNEIVWALNQRYDSCADLVSFCRAYASEYLQDKNIHFSFSCSEIPDRKIPGEVRRNVFLVIKEALHNLVKHAGAKNAGLSFSFDGKMQVKIYDDGKGFEPENIRAFANGLENMKKRVTGMGGHFQIIGDNGTTIFLSVPL